MTGVWDRWWELPGPNRLVHSLALALREGSSVLLSVPERTPPGLDIALERALEDDSRDFYRLAVPSGVPPSPGGFLQDIFCPDSPGDQLPSARNLARDSAFAGRFLWLTGVNRDIAEHWRDFAVSYTSAIRTEPEWRRTALVLALPATTPLPAEDIALTCRELSATAGLLDMQLFVAQLLQDATLAPHHYRLAVSAITKLSVFDPYLAIQLAQDPIASATAPKPLLDDTALERGWGPTTPDDWRYGTAAHLGGTTITHSALLAVQGGEAELNRRLWSAQLEVYFPLLEQRRRQLIAELSHHLIVPFHTPFGWINDKDDLELGHIEYQIVKRGITAPPDIRTQIPHLRELRNTLAHFSPAPPHKLLHSEIDSALKNLW